MKVNTDSWHYNVMCYYKWARKSFDDFGYSTQFDRWYASAGGVSLGNYRSFSVFKRYMTETGTYQPTDFCTYWRNVIVWPLVFVLLWSIPALLSFFIFHASSWFGLAFAGAIFGGSVVAVVGIVFLVLGITDWFDRRRNKPKKVKEPGFFSKVGESLRHPEFCTIMEYEKDGE